MSSSGKSHLGVAVSQSSDSPHQAKRTSFAQENDAAKAAPLNFAKLQALGNDFVVVCEEDLASSARAAGLKDWQAQIGLIAATVCDRHFGIGADGLIVARSCNELNCALSWIYTNSDGSASHMCGNGLRCLALWAVNRRLVTNKTFQIATTCGAIPIVFVDEDEITVDLGEPVLESTLVPVSGARRDKVVREPLAVEGRTLAVTCLSVGNPHCAIVGKQLTPAEFEVMAPKLQALSFFPEGVNVELVLPETGQAAQVLVWERGCGPTLACASGAAAALVAGVLEGALERTAQIKLPGGGLLVSWSAKDNHVRLTGPAQEVFCGSVNLKTLIMGRAHER